MNDNDFNMHNRVFTLQPTMTLGLLVEVQLQSLLTFSPKLEISGWHHAKAEEGAGHRLCLCKV
jgi:hypothetical protein